MLSLASLKVHKKTFETLQMSLWKMLKKKNIWSMFPFGPEVSGENILDLLENPDPRKEFTDNLFSQALEDFCQVLLMKS